MRANVDAILGSDWRVSEGGGVQFDPDSLRFANTAAMLTGVQGSDMRIGAFLREPRMDKA